mmetsp:Transcript_10141/g.25808  ORF Transcript_10141/g.25808 Transcript_10141/m.25808 type:complete len:265 (+) Transcript_10141:2451-3245(+)
MVPRIWAGLPARSAAIHFAVSPYSLATSAGLRLPAGAAPRAAACRCAWASARPRCRPSAHSSFSRSTSASEPGASAALPSDNARRRAISVPARASCPALRPARAPTTISATCAARHPSAPARAAENAASGSNSAYRPPSPACSRRFCHSSCRPRSSSSATALPCQALPPPSGRCVPTSGRSGHRRAHAPSSCSTICSRTIAWLRADALWMPPADDSARTWPTLAADAHICSVPASPSRSAMQPRASASWKPGSEESSVIPGSMA